MLPNHVDRLAGCQFLDVSKDGKTILGCWAISDWGLPGDSRRTSSRIMCLNVESDLDIVRLVIPPRSLALFEIRD